jgi:hypothetical protein
MPTRRIHAGGLEAVQGGRHTYGGRHHGLRDWKWIEKICLTRPVSVRPQAHGQRHAKRGTAAQRADFENPGKLPKRAQVQLPSLSSRCTTTLLISSTSTAGS